MTIQCPKCKTRYSAELGPFSEKGQKVECASCHHVFPVRQGTGDIDRTLTALKDRLEGWDTKMASLEGDSFTREVLHGDPSSGLADASGEDPGLPAAMEAQGREEEREDSEFSAMEEPGLEDLAGETGPDARGGPADASEEVIDNLFEEVESRDLLEDVQRGTSAGEEDRKGEEIFDAGKEPETPEKSQSETPAEEAPKGLDELDAAMDALLEDEETIPEPSRPMGPEAGAAGVNEVAEVPAEPGDAEEGGTDFASGEGDLAAEGTEESREKAEIISQDELNDLWGDALSEQQTSLEGEKTDQQETAGSPEKTEDLRDAAPGGEAAEKEPEENPREQETGEISQDELEGLLAQENASGEGKGDAAAELTELAAEEEEGRGGAGGEGPEAEGGIPKAEGKESFEIDDELLESKGPLEDELTGASQVKSRPRGKMRYVALSAIGLMVLGALGGGGYYAYQRITRPAPADSQGTRKLTAKAGGEKENSPQKNEEKVREAPEPEVPEGSGTGAAASPPSRVPVSEKKTLELGLIIPIQFGPLETKVLQADFIFEMKDHESYQRLKFYLPIYQDLMENVTNKFFSQGFYNEIHYAKEKLKDKLLEKFNEKMKGDGVKRVEVKKFIIDLKKKKRARPKKPPEKKPPEKKPGGKVQT